MTSSIKQDLYLAVAGDDKTFEKVNVGGVMHLVGKCIHCNTKIILTLQGDTVSATLEHIVPKGHGGTNDIKNLALACNPCNNHKGRFEDLKHANDPKFIQMVEFLQKKKLSRKRG